MSMLVACFRPFSLYRHPNNKMSVMTYPTVLAGGRDHGVQLALSLCMFLFTLAPFVAVNIWGTHAAGRRAQQKYDARTTRARLAHGDSMHIRFRFLLYRFRPQVWWWGNFLMLRQSLLAFAPAIPSSEPHLQVLFASGVLVCYGVRAAHEKPWKSGILNGVDIFLSISLAFFLLSSTAFMDPATDQAALYTILMLTFICSSMLALSTGIVSSVIEMMRQRSFADCFAKPFELWQLPCIGDTRDPGAIAAVWKLLCGHCSEIAEDDLHQLFLRMPASDYLDVVESISAWNALAPDVFPRAVPPQRRLIGVSHSLEDHLGLTTHCLVGEINARRESSIQAENDKRESLGSTLGRDDQPAVYLSGQRSTQNVTLEEEQEASELALRKDSQLRTAGSEKQLKADIEKRLPIGPIPDHLRLFCAHGCYQDCSVRTCPRASGHASQSNPDHLSGHLSQANQLATAPKPWRQLRVRKDSQVEA